MDAIEHELSRQSPGIVVSRLNIRDGRLFLQRWREVFARGVKEKTGKWTFKGFDWHAFSYKFTPAKEGIRARDEYHAMKCGEAIVMILGIGGQPIFFRLVGRLPTGDSLQIIVDNQASPIDLYISDPQANWTMVFTHEVSSGIGPFFSKAVD